MKTNNDDLIHLTYRCHNCLHVFTITEPAHNDKRQTHKNIKCERCDSILLLNLGGNLIGKRSSNPWILDG